MKKHSHLVWFLAGWLLSLLFSPMIVLGLFKGVLGGGGKP